LAGIVPLKISRIEAGQKPADSRRARNYLAKLVLGKVVDIKGYGLDQYERILSVVFLKGKNINLEMIRAGLAVVCKGNSSIGFDLEPYQKVEEEARKAKRGMWVMRSSRSPE